MSTTDTTAARDRVRYSIEMPCVLDKRVQQMADEQGFTKTELIRRALVAMMKYAELEEQGYDVAATKRDKNGQDRVKLVVV